MTPEKAKANAVLWEKRNGLKAKDLQKLLSLCYWLRDSFLKVVSGKNGMEVGLVIPKYSGASRTVRAGQLALSRFLKRIYPYFDDIGTAPWHQER